VPPGPAHVAYGPKTVRVYKDGPIWRLVSQISPRHQDFLSIAQSHPDTVFQRFAEFI